MKNKFSLYLATIILFCLAFVVNFPTAGISAANDQEKIPTQLGVPSLVPLSSFSPSPPDELNATSENTPMVTTPSLPSSLPMLSPTIKNLSAPFTGKAEKSITLFVPEPKDGQIAAYYNLMADFLNKQAQGTMKLEYAPGRGGADAINRLSLQKIDGVSMSGIIVPAFLLQPMMPDKRFEPTSVVPIVLLSGTPTVLWVSEKSPFRTISEFVAGVRNHPMDSYIAGTGSNTGHHMTTYVFNRAAGISLQYLPYLGSAQAARAVVKGTALACWGAGSPKAFMPGLRPLAIAAPVRSPFYPETPTFAEKGIIMDASDQFGICMPTSTEESLRHAASDLFVSMANDPEFQERSGSLGFASSVIPYSGMQEYMKQIKEALQLFLDSYAITPHL